MVTLTTVREMREFSESARREGKTVALVPTMGYLHDGHISLVRKARTSADVVVASIFVNPAQFGPNEDLSRYPKDMEGDSAKLKESGVDALFAPTASEMYPEGFRTSVVPGKVADRLCGASRPGHFRGVATVVTKLFAIVRPHTAFFGQKDYQQTLVIKQLACDLNLGVAICVQPVVRESDGLAMSSRNAYLSPAERAKAALLYKSLRTAEEIFDSGERRALELKREMERVLCGPDGIKVEYLAICSADTLEEISQADQGDIIALAATIGRTRLIDNIIL